MEDSTIKFIAKTYVNKNKYVSYEERNIFQAFVAGARWHRNKAWHKLQKETPELGKFIVTEHFNSIIYNNPDEIKKAREQKEYIYWAYWCDLHPYPMKQRVGEFIPVNIEEK